MAYIYFDIALHTDILEPFLHAHRCLQFVKGALKQEKMDYKLVKLLKFAHKFYLFRAKTQLQDYHNLIQERYFNVDPSILMMLLRLPEKILATCLIPSWDGEGRNLRDTLRSQINDEIVGAVLHNVGELQLQRSYGLTYTRYNVAQRYHWIHQHGSSSIFLLIMVFALACSVGLVIALIVIAAVKGWLLLAFPLIAMGYLLLGLTCGLYLAFQYDQKFVGMDTLVSDLGSPEHLEYTSLKFRCLYAVGLQPISTASTQCLDYFETTSLMRFHPHLILDLTKSKLNQQDILSFILSLPPIALTDDSVFAAIMLVLKYRHDIQAIQAMRALQRSLENHTPKTSNEQFSLAIIHRSGLFGVRQDRDKAKQFFQAISYKDSNYYNAKIELGSMALSDAASSAPSVFSQRKLLEAHDHFSIAETFASTEEEKEMAKGLCEHTL